MLRVRMTQGVCVLFFVALVMGSFSNTVVAEEQGTYSPLSFADAKEKSLAWAKTNVSDAKALSSIDQVWKKAPDAKVVPGSEILTRVIRTFRLGDKGVDQFLGGCDLLNLPKIPLELEEDSKLISGKSEFFKSNLLLRYGHFLTQARFYDEALDVIQLAKPEEVADPATYFFSQAVCEHQLLQKPEGLKSVKILLEKTEEVPRRYLALANVMQYELKGLRAGSLDEVSRLMNNVGRNLGHARAGQKVQKEEEEIIASLDAIIEKMEAGGGGGGGGGGGQDPGNQSSGPAENGYNAKGKAAGKVDKKHLKSTNGWGDLDKKEQANVKNIMKSSFPSSFERIIEEYSHASAKKKK